MLFKGTERRNAREIAEAMDRVGGNLNAFTDKESTCYYARVIDKHVPLATDVLCDMFLNSRFDPDDLAREQNVVLEEIKMYDDAPDEVINDAFVRLMWYRLGSRRSGDRISANDRRCAPAICARTCASAIPPIPSSSPSPETSSTIESSNPFRGRWRRSAATAAFRRINVFVFARPSRRYARRRAGLF